MILSIVAPHAGALVETVPVPKGDGPDLVAPHAGALVETTLYEIGDFDESRASRRRVS